jgi:hypothetical protein
VGIAGLRVFVASIGRTNLVFVKVSGILPGAALTGSAIAAMVNKGTSFVHM